MFNQITFDFDSPKIINITGLVNEIKNQLIEISSILNDPNLIIDIEDIENIYDISYLYTIKDFMTKIINISTKNSNQTVLINMLKPLFVLLNPEKEIKLKKPSEIIKEQKNIFYKYYEEI